MFRLLAGAALVVSALAPDAAEAVLIANDSEREISITVTAADHPPSAPAKIDPGAAMDLPGLCLGGCKIRIVVGTQPPLETEADDDNFLVVFKGKRAVSVLEIEEGSP